jgi:hypothetical protein
MINDEMRITAARLSSSSGSGRFMMVEAVVVVSVKNCVAA